MKDQTIRRSLRGAIYTRVSTDQGLEQDFNSLDAQREACEAYIKSQAHEGWRLVRDRYDDGGFSGGSMVRPALQKLLTDVAARRIDVIVVYKVDRLTRSLADFAKLVETFDAYGVSFVSVTQSFNTTTSMGRLTLNVLLSFAQFEREVYLAEAQRLSNMGSWAFNVATRQFIHSSEEHHRLFGFDPREGMPGWEDWIRRLHPEDRERTMGTIERGICERTDFELDCRAAHPDGTIKYVHTLGHPVLNPSGDLVEFVGTSIDMTERRRAEEARLDAQNQLAHANRVTAMGQLAASIAHEVNQPIAATVTNAEAALRWLDRRPPDLEEVRQTLACIAKDGNRAAEVIDEIRALIKKAPPRKDRLEINGAIREVIGLTRGEVVKNGVWVHAELAEGLPLIQGDRVQLQQVILNLVINSVEAMSGVGEGARELLISTGKAEPDSVLVAVRDSGPGLAPATLERLFESFYTTKPSGLGLGLSICRSIIEAHGGRLWACANVPRGAVFQFTMPAQPDTGS